MVKTRVAVMFGGRAPEHDVSVVTGLQALQVLDSRKYEAFPVYVDSEGNWFIGDGLRFRKNYLPDAALMKKLTPVMLDCRPGFSARLVHRHKGFFEKGRVFEFDVALLAFHGTIGEDGAIQGLLETAAVPYTGMRLLASALFMDKVATKKALRGLGVPCLPDIVFERPKEGLVIELDALKEKLGDMALPLCVKPAHMGSSIGVGKADSLETLQSLLANIFIHDWQALAEPFIDHLVEYNVAVSAFDGPIVTSAIEQPKRSDALLDFKQKYLSGGKTGKSESIKQPGTDSEGMLSLTRTINPDLDPSSDDLIRRTAVKIFDAFGPIGAPRLDFYGNEETGELWFNELNPCPGSFGFFLWEAAQKPFLFSQLLDGLIDQAVRLEAERKHQGDLVPVDARLLKR